MKKVLNFRLTNDRNDHVEIIDRDHAAKLLGCALEHPTGLVQAKVGSERGRRGYDFTLGRVNFRIRPVGNPYRLCDFDEYTRWMDMTSDSVPSHEHFSSLTISERQTIKDIVNR